MKKNLKVKVLALATIVGMGSMFALGSQLVPNTLVLAEESQSEVEEAEANESSLIEIEGEEIKDDSSTGEEGDFVQFEDTIDYSKLDMKKEYLLRATLYMADPTGENDKEEEGREWAPVVDQDGLPIIEYLAFMPPSESGQINYTMTLDATLLEAQGDKSFRIIYKVFEAKDMGDEFNKENSDFV